MASLFGGLLNNGPGWFNDILTVQIFFDADLEERASLATVEKVPQADGSVESVVSYARSLFASGATIQGFVRVTAPPGRTVPHSGIVARLESAFVTTEDVLSQDLHEEETDLVAAGDVTGSVDYPFLFPGSALHPLLDSYEGDLFSVRHTVTVSVNRPWYTFDVAQSAPVSVQRIFNIPRLAASTPAHSAAKQQGGVEGSPLALGATAASAGGRGPSGSISLSMDGAGPAIIVHEDEHILAAAAKEAAAAAAAPAAAAAGAGAAAAATTGTGKVSQEMSAQLALYGEQVMLIEGVGNDALDNDEDEDEEEDDEEEGGASDPKAAADRAAAKAAAKKAREAARAAAAAAARKDPASTGNGSVEVRFNKACFEIGEALTGSIEFYGMTVPVVMVRLAIVKLETLALGNASAGTAGGASGPTFPLEPHVVDTVVFDDVLMDARRWKARKNHGIMMARLAEAAESQREKRALAASRGAAGAAGAAGTGIATAAAKDGASTTVAAPAPAGAAKVVPAGEDGEEEEHDGGEEEEEGEGEGVERTPEDEEDAAAAEAAAQAAAAEAEADADNWYPDEEDQAGTGEDGEEVEADPDLPILGDVSLAIELDFAQLEGLTPTLVFDVSKHAEAGGMDVAAAKKRRSEALAAARKLAAASGGAPVLSEDDDEASVRYYLRVTVYTRFDTASRRWNAQEIILYRGELIGQEVLPGMRPLPNYATIGGATKRAGSAPAAAAAGAASGGKPAGVASGAVTTSRGRSGTGTGDAAGTGPGAELPPLATKRSTSSIGGDTLEGATSPNLTAALPRLSSAGRNSSSGAGTPVLGPATAAAPAASGGSGRFSFNVGSLMTSRQSSSATTSALSPHTPMVMGTSAGPLDIDEEASLDLAESGMSARASQPPAGPVVETRPSRGSSYGGRPPLSSRSTPSTAAAAAAAAASAPAAPGSAGTPTDRSGGAGGIARSISGFGPGAASPKAQPLAAPSASV